jgi:L-ascorbate metabolism protein UlaG (beta-lactamase superfamily)
MQLSYFLHHSAPSTAAEGFRGNYFSLHTVGENTAKTDELQNDRITPDMNSTRRPFSRRRFLSGLGISVLSSPILLAQERLQRRTRWEMIAHDEPILPSPCTPDPSSWDTSTITAAWIGHSTVLLNLFGTTIVTDPVLSERIGLDVAGLFTIGPQRLVSPALTFEQLPPIDLILLSHAHMDHLDTPTLRKFSRTTPVVIAKNTFDVIEGLGFEAIYEMDWADWTQVGDVRIDALEVKHFGWRYPWEKDRSRGHWNGRSYNAYLISKNGGRILFAGDTAYHQKFKALKERDLSIDLAILPIGAYDPWIHNHANPEQALEMADHMGAHSVMPIHWRTFIQSEEPTLEPIQRLKRAAADQPDRIAIDDIGQTWSLAAATPQTHLSLTQGPPSSTRKEQ